MKVSTLASFIFGLVSVASAQTSQTLAPSPTESVGCHPHGDHWHCDGPRTDSGEVTSGVPTLSETAAPTVTTEHEHHESETDTASLPPSPTESVGCHPHGDHWHCDGPASTTAGGEETSPVTSPTASASDPVVTAGAPGTGVAGGVGVLGLAAAVAMVL